LKKIGTNQPLEVRMPPAFQKLVDYWVKNGPRPTAAEAEEALNSLVQNIRLENNIVHREVLDSLFLP
ncbi:MAG TPA: glycosyl hydrolase family 5, partial [Puia sp.]|nr:glycosyl hydrolase family 5 [Puia sp.]